MGLALPRDFLGIGSAEIADIAAAIDGCIGVDDFLVPAPAIDPNPVMFAYDGGCVDDKYQDLACAGFALESDHGVIAVVEIDPFKPGVTVVLVIEGRFSLINPVQVL